MHSRFLLLPAAALALSPAPLPALDVQTLEAAQKKLAPGATLTPVEYRLTPEQSAQIRRQYRVPVLRTQMKSWKVDGARGGWIYLDQVFGRDDVITYLVALGLDGRVNGLEVLVCEEGYCDVFTPRWRASFHGKAPDGWAPADDVPMVSGRTLSTMHVAEGVKKILAIHARYAPGVGTEAPR